MRGFLAGALLVGAGLIASVPRAHAGGYDTPILYSARHMGMGGTAVSYVRDPSALFHNPAGLGHVGKGAVLVNVSPLIGSIKGAPVGPTIDSETTFAPFFLLGGAYRITDWLTAGFAAYPVASAGGEYKYSIGGMEARTSTELVFLEASPGLAVNLPQGFNLGLGYRITYATLKRFQGLEGSPFLDFDITGINFLGLRAGVQWEHDFDAHHVAVGLNYRHKTETNLKADEGIAGAQTYEDISMKFVLPSRLTGGVRYDYDNLGVAFDAEYGFNSQNEGYPLKGTQVGTTNPDAIDNYFRWSDSLTLRTGVEYRLVDGHVPVRVGYIWDQKTANERFPSAFGTPPGDGHVGTIGTGWKTRDWQVNAAYAYRTVKGEVTQADIDAGRAELLAEQGVPSTCAFCSQPGDYELTMHGIYIDFSYDF